MVTKKTKKVAKRYLPSIVLVGSGINFVYVLSDTKSLTKKSVEKLDIKIQKMIESGELKLSLAYKEV